MCLFKNGDSQDPPRSADACSLETDLWNLCFLNQLSGPFLDLLKPENLAVGSHKYTIVH